MQKQRLGRKRRYVKPVSREDVQVATKRYLEAGGTITQLRTNFKVVPNTRLDGEEFMEFFTDNAFVNRSELSRKFR